MPASPASLLPLVLTCLACSCGITQAFDGPKFFQEKVEPILREHCYECHSHATNTMKGGLTLDSRSGWLQGGDSGPAITANDPQQSLLISAIQYQDLQMPPAGKLPDEQIAVLVEWVKQGAYDPRELAPVPQNPDTFWSLKPLVRPTVPNLADHPIDAFISATHQHHSLSFSEPASRTILIQRLYFDLLGLPPSPAEVQAFVTDPSPDAYRLLVDRLLESPHYGERWARHWMDTIHFADTHGYEHDVGRDHAWPYRDYLINALNQDTPWDRLIREQLAADYFYPDESNLIPALGFLGAGVFDQSTFSTAPVTFDYLDRDDLVTQTMAAFTSTTANCARCHAHKFDPITQEDYYSLQAVFAGIIKGDISYDPNPETQRYRKQLQALLTRTEQRDPSLSQQAELQPIIEQWITRHQQPVPWKPIQLTTYTSTEGATLVARNHHDVIASGTRPDKDQYVISGTTALSQVTAIQLEVLSDPSLPFQGPGRQDNGNLHLSEVVIQYFDPAVQQPHQAKVATATADFNQSAWTIEHAIDNNPATAWGIYPQVGQSHRAVFTLAEPIKTNPSGYLTVVLKQLHGGGHLIGACRISVTDHPAADVTALPSEIDSALHQPASQRTPEQQLAIAALAIQHHAQSEISKLPPQQTVFAAGKSVQLPTGENQRQSVAIAKPKPVHVLHRGDIAQPRKEVAPGSLSALTHLPARFSLQNLDDESSRRAALADWLAHRDNVLTWRSIVNRVWHYHFGRGICDTPSDFGRMGGAPTHEALLDWLAVWFRDDAHGSLKALHRLIVTSQTYQQSAERRSACESIDAENRYLWRQNRQRLDADAFRDYVMKTAGTLNHVMGGPAVQYFSRKPGIQATPVLDYQAFDWNQPGVTRRSIYRYVWRGIPDPLMEQLDFPDLGLLAPTRSFSASSLQAIQLFNHDFVLSQSAAFARQTVAITDEPTEQVRSIVETCWLREPTADELKCFTDFVSQHGLENLCRLLFNSNEFLFVE